MAEPVRDRETVTPEGERLESVPDGVRFKDIVTHVDDRGAVFELFDMRWDWHPDPVVFSYIFTVRPGVVKGWGIHHQHEDRYCILSGEMEVVLYDPRDDSPTRGLVSKIYMTEHRRRLMSIPAGVWHADRNIGQTDAVMINFPTIVYDHSNPDKYRLPIDTDQIPHSFEGARGG